MNDTERLSKELNNNYILPYNRRYWPGQIIASGNPYDKNLYQVTEYRTPKKDDYVINAYVVYQFETNFPHPPLWIVKKNENAKVLQSCSC